MKMPGRWRRCCRWRLAGSQFEGGLVYLPVRLAAGTENLDAVEIYDHELEAFRLVHLEGLSVGDAAARLGVSKATLWRALESCRAKLARALAERRPFRILESLAALEHPGADGSII